MEKYIDEINYDDLVNKSLRNVVYHALKIAENQGLPSENHFYITFHTNYPGTVISKNLKIQYPESMTIVLQNQFENLTVRHNSFSVDLKFGGIPQTVTVPYDAITYFADPYAKFGLSFENDDDLEINENEDSQLAEPQSQIGQSAIAPVVSIDKYRRK